MRKKTECALDQWLAYKSVLHFSDSDEGPVLKTAKEYGESTTVHGIPYILEDGRHPLERILWIILVGIGAGMAAFLSLNIYNDWQSNQIITSVGTTGYSIENIEFPAVTICAQGSIQRVTGNFTMPLTFENCIVEYTLLIGFTEKTSF